MPNYPKISIITPSFNQGQYIRQTIRSVLDQGYPNLEYIIVDGGSIDHTVEIIKEYEDQITWWVSEPDKGQSDAINKGFARATGDIVNWLNSDDYLEPGALQKIAAAFSDQRTKAVTTLVHNFDDAGLTWDERTLTQPNAAHYIAKAFNLQPGTYFQKNVWDHYFPIPKQLNYTMDQYLWLCFWLEHDVSNFKHESFTTVNFRRHHHSKTSQSTRELIFNTLGERFFNEHNLIFWSFFKTFEPKYAQVIESYFSKTYDYRTKILSFPIGISVSPETVTSIFQLYLTELVKEDYNHGFYNRLKNSLAFINVETLPDADQTAIEKIRSKIKSLFVLKIYRSLYWAGKRILKKK